MSTLTLKIMNDEVIESQCKQDTAVAVASVDDDSVDDGEEISPENDVDICPEDWVEYQNQRVFEWGQHASNEQEFTSLEEAKTQCMKLLEDDCKSVEEHRKPNSKVYSLKRWGKIFDQSSSKHTSYERPRRCQDGW